MKTMKTYLRIILGILSFGANLQAQYITIDKDGYTNIRKQPNAQSGIVGKVYKYQVFYAAKDIPCSDGEFMDDSSNWLQITTDMNTAAGYIYKKMVYPLDELPLLNNIKEDENVFICRNDSIEVTLITQPFDRKAHKIKKIQIEEDYQMEVIEGERAYGTDGWLPYNEIKEISVKYKGKKLLLPRSKFKHFYDPRGMSVRVGSDNELYIMFGGGDGSGWYDVCLSVVNGDIVYSIVSEC